MKEIFKQLIGEFINKDLSFVKERSLTINPGIRKVISIIGARRTGKTYYLFQLINALRKEHSREKMVYINFEDDRLFPCNLEDLEDFMDAYYEMYPEMKKTEAYFFFDEIQNVKNWEKFIRRIYDSENCRIFISGSSSKYLSKEIATSLRGRSVGYELFPLSFKEYISFRHINEDYYVSYNRSRIKNALTRYIGYSSMPELVNADEDEVRKILKNYLDLVIYKDLLERYGLKNIYLIKYLLKFLIINSGNLFSHNKLYNDFKSQGLNIARESVYDYMEHIKDAYIAFTIPIFSDNIREINRNPQKTYFMDTGFKNIISIQKDKGRAIETVVFLELRRKHEEIFYFKKEREVDFCFYEKNKLKLINVSIDLRDKKTKEREVNSLFEAMKYFNVKNSDIINLESEEIVNLGKKKIEIMPLWKWLLKKKQ